VKHHVQFFILIDKKAIYFNIEFLSSTYSVYSEAYILCPVLTKYYMISEHVYTNDNYIICVKLQLSEEFKYSIISE